jgi:hypothetical protein
LADLKRVNNVWKKNIGHLNQTSLVCFASLAAKS